MNRSLVGFGLVLVALNSAVAQQPGWPSPDGTAYSSLSILEKAEFRAAAPQCREERVFATPDSVGPIRVGSSFRDVLSLCSDQGLRVWDWGSEGVPTPAVLQRFGSVLVLTLLEDTTMQSPVYSVASADAQTPEGITGGSTFSDLVSAYKNVQLFEGECTLWVVAAGADGLSFRIELPEDEDMRCSQLALIAASNDVSSVPGRSVVRLLNYYGR